MYIIYSRQAYSIILIIIFQLEFNYIAQGDVNNKGTHFMFRLKNTRLICPITARFEVFRSGDDEGGGILDCLFLKREA